MPAGKLVAGAPAAITAAFPRAPLGRWPTPLERHDRLAAALGVDRLWVKRDDLSAEPYGGHKVRALELLLAPLRPGGSVLTVGGSGSTHCLATAVYARRAGLAPCVAQFPQPPTDAALRHAAAIVRWAEVCERARWRVTFPVALARALWRAWRRRPVHWIAPGASSPLGTVGYLLAGFEVAAQLADENLPPPDAVVVALGSGGTAAGLALTFESLGWPTLVVGVRVVDAPVASRWWVLRLAGRTARLVERRAGVTLAAPRPDRVLVVTSQLGRGYGHPTPQGDALTHQARELGGIDLDPTYTAKALAGLSVVAHAEPGRFRSVVFWHTFSARLPDAP